jgi:hypothetical protein
VQKIKSCRFRRIPNSGRCDSGIVGEIDRIDVPPANREPLEWVGVAGADRTVGASVQRLALNGRLVLQFRSGLNMIVLSPGESLMGSLPGYGEKT